MNDKYSSLLAKRALCDMVNHFAYNAKPYYRKPALHPGGLSALESAFIALETMGARLTEDGRLPRKELWRIWDEIEKEIDEYDD